MNGIHDMGGMQDMGPIRADKHEPVFHSVWEARVFALDLAVPAEWTGSAERHQIELIPPADYLCMSYYEKWMTSLAELMVKSGMLTSDEVKSGRSAGVSSKSAQALKPSEVAHVIAKGSPSTRDTPVNPRFHAGQRVRARNINPVGHTRLPRYARAKLGTVERDHGVHVFSDTDAHGLGEKPQHVYSVRFGARDLWGDKSSRHDSVYVDLWDDHLEPE